MVVLRAAKRKRIAVSVLIPAVVCAAATMFVQPAVSAPLPHVISRQVDRLLLRTMSGDGELERYFEYEVPASVQEACTEIRMRLPSGLIEDYSVLDAEGDEVPFRCERASGAAPEGRDPVRSPPPGQPAYRTGKLSR